MDSIDRPTLSSAGEAPPPPPAERPAPIAAPFVSALPSVRDFLLRTYDVGRRSLAPALPVLVVLYFYRFGMGLYMIASSNVTSPMGYPDYQLRAATWIVAAAAYLPLLVLIYTPFLPFQDALYRGERRSFIDAVKHVLEHLVPYGLSSIYQTLFIVIPATVVVLGAAAGAMALGAIPVEARSILVLLALFPAGLWIAFAMFLLAFATPLLILDGRGPMESIRESFALVRENFGGLLWRFVVAVALLTLAMVLASFPSTMLAVLTSVAKEKLMPVEIARLFWDSAVGTLAFPFTVAAMIVLYRALVPPREAAGAAATATPASPADGGAPATPPTPPNAEPVATTPPYSFE
ncbi:MAG TPA: hypothetical protein VFU59_06175 [Candidatus Eisenbacteria bacterium]|nr:hypothetical protein [Candidatus Eisenbacteria bacterium]